MKEPSLIFKLHSSGLNALSKAYFPVMAGEAAVTVVTDAVITNPVEAQAARPALVAAARPPPTPPQLFIWSSPPPLARQRPVVVAAAAAEEAIPLQDY